MKDLLSDCLFDSYRIEQILRWAFRLLSERQNHPITDTNNCVAGLAHVYRLQKHIKALQVKDKEGARDGGE